MVFFCSCWMLPTVLLYHNEYELIEELDEIFRQTFDSYYSEKGLGRTIGNYVKRITEIRDKMIDNINIESGDTIGFTLSKSPSSEEPMKK